MQRSNAHYLYWTAKEAYRKGRGEGLSASLHTVEIQAERASGTYCSLQITESGSDELWSITSLQVAQIFQCLVVVEGPPRFLTVQEWFSSKLNDPVGAHRRGAPFQTKPPSPEIATRRIDGGVISFHDGDRKRSWASFSTTMYAESLLNIRPSVLRPSRITEMTRLGKSLGAIDLAQGFPDENPPIEVQELYLEACASGLAHQYADPRGIPALRESLSAKLEAWNGIAAHPETQIAVTCGATGGLMAAFRSLFNPGDEIVAFSPLYENYLRMADATGVRIRPITLQEPDFSFDEVSLRRSVTAKTRAVLFSNPCNPTGKVFSAGELASIIEFAQHHRLLIIADETYEHFVWRGKHISIASLPGGAERTLTVFSLGKTYSATGWRIGCVVGAEELIQPITRMHELTTISAPHPFQVALASALQLPASFHSELLRTYSERKSLLSSAVASIGMKPWDPAGAYFLWTSYAELSSDDDFLFSDWLIRNVGIASVAGGVFVPPGAPNPKRVRLTFSKSLKTIREAARHLVEAGSLVLS